MILSCMLEPPENIVFSWIERLTQDIQPHCAVAVGGAGLSSYEKLFEQQGIPYLRTIQDVDVFTTNSHAIHSTDLHAFSFKG